MVHAVSASFERFEHMSPPALGLAALLHALVAAFLLWAPVHHPPEPDEAIEVTMEAPPPPPPPPPEKKPQPEAPKPPPQVQQAKPPPPQQLPGLVPPGAIGPKSTAPPMERGETTRQLPPQPAPEKAEPPASKDEPPPKQEPPQQATARPAEPPPPPPPTLEKELPPVEGPPAPVTSRDIPRFSPPAPEPKPEPPPRPPQPPVQPRAPPQVAPSPLSRLPRNSPSSPRESEPPRSTFVNPADTYAQNTLLDAYLQRVVFQVSRYRFDGTGLSPTDSVVARFTIARNGSLLGVAIVRSSGKPNLDRDAAAAFQQVAPFPPLPAEVSGDSHTFILTFWPGRAH